jgi:RHS repeat-associated protein
MSSARSDLVKLAALLALGGCVGKDNESINKVTQASTQTGHVAFAHHSMWLRQNSSVAGNAAVRDPSSGPYVGDDAEMTVGIGASVSGEVRGDTVRLKMNASVSADVLGNELVQGDGSTIGGSFVSPLSLPLADLIPAMPSFQPGTQDVTVTGQTTLVLSAGDYATLKLKQGTQGSPTVVKLDGTYNLHTLDMGLNTRVECTAACEVRIKGKLLGDQNGYIGPAAGAALTAKDVKIFVEGINGSNGNLGATPKAAKIGLSNEVRAHIYAPNGTLLVKQSSVVHGVLIGKWVQIGIGVSATVEDPLDGPGDDAGAPDAALDAGAPPDGPLPDLTAAPDACVPTTCAAQGANCGAIDDACGGTLNCGTCAAPETCGGGGVPNVCGCTPTTCAAEGVNCGTIPDGCGGTLECGTCMPPETCGGGGVPNICGCTATTCAAEGKDCGTIDDGCGGTLGCGICAPPDTCGGGGVANVCGCTPTTCAAEGKDCGTIDDGCGGTLECGACPIGQVCGWGGAPNMCGGRPPDPTVVAPPLDPTQTTSMYEATEFLYSGPTPIQTGVVPGMIEPQRAAVLRGRVFDTQGSGLAGATVTVLGHDEYGRTVTRADGGYDLAVNGGDLLTLVYELSSHVTVQRQTRVPWQDYVVMDEVVLTPLDPQVTTVSSFAGMMQVAQGSTVTDTDGTRQATLLFPAATGAVMTLPDGSTQPLSSLSVRATELTVGASGPAAMPAQLPSHLAYTYAVELSMDEAIAAGATRVDFSNPVVNYVDNFIGFPVGEPVPSGYYDRERGVWVPGLSGRVVKILSVTGGQVELDIDGSGLPADAAALAALGVTAEEREKLANIYPVGHVLWRVPITHFSTWDFNWPWGGPPRPRLKDPEPDPDDNPTCNEPGSIIECQNQVLRESIAVAGTPWSLNYSSARVESGRPLTIYVTGSSVSPLLHGVELQVMVAGRSETKSFPPTAGQTYQFSWDGKDAYGRTTQGKKTVLVRYTYLYDASYFGTDCFNCVSSGSAMAGTRREIPYSFTWLSERGVMGGWDARGHGGVGGWTLDVQHSYDPVGRTLYLGDGTRRGGRDSVSHVMSTVAGTGAEGYSGDGGPAAEAMLDGPDRVVVDGEGNLFIAGADNRIRRVDRDGTITTVAGIGNPGGMHACSGDGGPATSAQLSLTSGLALDAQGNLYFSEGSASGCFKVRRVGTDGIITTVAGTGVMGYGGDGGPATAAQLNRPAGLAVDRDGNLFIADNGDHRIRRVGTDGTIMTVAGTGVSGYSGDNGPAINAKLYTPWSIAVDDHGNLYVGDSNNPRVRRISPDGIITRYAGTGYTPYPGYPGDDGGLATNARLNGASGLAVDRRGNLYIASYSGIRMVNADGIISTVAGNAYGLNGYGGDGGPATAASFENAFGVAIGPLGEIYIADLDNSRIRKASPFLPNFTSGETLIASDDGGRLYHFSVAGKHLRTLNTLTGATVYTFNYDPNGVLSKVVDGDGNETTIHRGGSGNPTSIEGPFGQTAILGVDSNGMLSSVANPSGQTHQMTYTTGGLLQSHTDPRSNTYQYAFYGAELTLASDPAGGSSSLTRTGSVANETVSLTTGEGRTTSYKTVKELDGDLYQKNTFPSGLSNYSYRRENGSSTVTFADGTTSEEQQGPDPRFGMQAPISSGTNVSTPGGRSHTTAHTRTVSLADPQDLLSLATQTDQYLINGRTHTSVFDGATRRHTTTTPAGRVTHTDIDAQGRVVGQQVPGLAPTTFAYDSHGRLAAVTEGTGAAARVTSIAYDGQGFVDNITDPLSRTVTFQYDPAGRVTQQTLPGGRVVLFGYDQNGNMTSITPPCRPAHAFDYTPVDLGESYAPPAVTGSGTTQTTYAYNKDRQLTLVTRPDGKTIQLGYDTAGRLASMTIPRGGLGYTYDASTGTLKTVTSPDGVTLTYGYDGSLLTSSAWGGTVAGSVTRTHDNDFRVTSRSVNGAHTASFGYDLDGLLTQAGGLTIARDAASGFISGTTLGSVTTARGYSAFGELASSTASHGANGLYSATYTRDALGRIESLVETVEGVTTTKSYLYDAAGRLKRAIESGVVVGDYTYDQNGNRTQVTSDLGVTVNGTHDAQDRLLTYGGNTYAYTANGELSSRTTPTGTTTYTYDVLGNLTTVTLEDGTSIEYVIDGQNRRVGKKVGGTLVQGFLHKDRLNPVAELDGAGNVVARFVYGTKQNVPDYMEKGGVTYRILSDHLGSVRLVVDAATGTVAQRIDYDEFGRVLMDTAPGFQPFGFAGGLYDHQTKLVRFGARDYDAEVGRWTAKDPLGFARGLGNLYAYVDGDPVNTTDPTGADGLPDTPLSDDNLRGLSEQELRQLYDKMRREGKTQEAKKVQEWQKRQGQRNKQKRKPPKKKDPGANKCKGPTLFDDPEAFWRELFGRPGGLVPPLPLGPPPIIPLPVAPPVAPPLIPIPLF